MLYMNNAHGPLQMDDLYLDEIMENPVVDGEMDTVDPVFDVPTQPSYSEFGMGGGAMAQMEPQEQPSVEDMKKMFREMLRNDYAKGQNSSIGFRNKIGAMNSGDR